MNQPIIFLDVDGVLNSHDWWYRRKEQGEEQRELVGLYDLDPLACQRLQRVCEDTGAALVISSTWRLYHDLDDLRDLFRQRGLTAEVIGRTPDLRHHERAFEEPWNQFGRGLEVQWWLQNYLPSDEAMCNARFVCLDDDGDFGDLRGKLVQTRMATGFTDLEIPYILKHLSEPLMDSMAAGGKGRVFFGKDAKALEPWHKSKPIGPGGG